MIDDGFETFLDSGKRTLVQCKVCIANSDIIIRFKATRPPAIALQSGTIPRQSVLNGHLLSRIRKEAVKLQEI